MRWVRADTAGIAEAAQVLAAGGLVAFPTETVYGLGANAWNDAACRRIFAAKGRPADNPLIVHVTDAAEAQRLAAHWPSRARTLAAEFWPGPLTLVVASRPTVPESVRAGLSTVAIRCPAHPVARALIRAAQVPVAAPSANASGRPSPTTAEAVRDDLGDRVDLVVDGGPTGIGVESTVVDVSGPRPILLRPGGLPRERIEQVVGPLAAPDLAGPVRSPGMKYRHYAPERPLILLRCSPGEAVRRIRATFAPQTTGVLGPQAVVAALADYAVIDLGPDDVSAARRLFSGLRELDRRAGIERIVAVWWSEDGLGLAVSNRLERAAQEVWT